MSKKSWNGQIPALLTRMSRPPSSVATLVEHRDDGIGIGDVGRHRERPPAELADLTDGVVDVGAIVSSELGLLGYVVVEGNVCPGTGKADRHGPPDSTRCAGDEGPTTLQAELSHGSSRPSTARRAGDHLLTLATESFDLDLHDVALLEVREPSGQGNTFGRARVDQITGFEGHELTQIPDQVSERRRSCRQSSSPDVVSR